ncbi:MAG: 3-dehydroquinate synthase [Bacteroidetes bacterium]|nr:3-dehydroquinate synthase [Bacteroidota bacterium]
MVIHGIATFKQWLEQKHFTKIVVIGDANGFAHCLPHVHQVGIIEGLWLEVGVGEKHKELETCSWLWQQLMEKEVDRSALIINLGGGVVTDLGGFVASTYKRGVSFVNVPTTLLGMVDAAIGHKTGINFGEAKNQVGTMSAPLAVVIDPIFLASLPNMELLSGLGELIKYGLIADAPLFHALGSIEMGKDQTVIARCIDIKMAITKEDPNEKGVRRMLNYGHSVGHALEAHAYHLGQPIPHGVAVAWGMVAEAHLSEKLAGFADTDLVWNKINHLFPIPEILYQADLARAIGSYLTQDKKNSSGLIQSALLYKIGQGKIGFNIEKEDFSSSVSWLQQRLLA